MPRGGARKGAGRKKGPVALDKEAARELVRKRVIKHLGPLLDAQISNATGIKFLVVRDKRTGKFLRVNEGRAAALKPDEEIIEIWDKDPSVQAFTDLMNRALDKPAEQVKVTGEDGGPVVHLFRWQK
jgi:hypothetical protein